MAILGQYNFATVNTGESGVGYAADVSAAGVVNSDLTDGGVNGVLSIHTGGTYASNPVCALRSNNVASTTVAEAITNACYVQWSHTPASGKKLNLTSLTFDASRGGASTPRGYALRSSVDGYTANLATADLATARADGIFTPITVDLSGPSFQNLTTAITFRMYQYAPSVNLQIDFDNLVLNGTVADSSGLLTSITGAAWPTSGAASAATTGLNSVTGGTHVGSTDLPAEAIAAGCTGYVKGADNAALAWKIDGSATPMPTNESDYWMSTWLRPARTAAALPADQTGVQFQAWSNSGEKLIQYLHIRNTTHLKGLVVQPAEFMTGGDTSEKMYDSGSTGSTPVIYFDRWAHICSHVKRSTAGGILEMYVNGVLIQRITGLNTDGEVTAAQLAATTQFNWPAISGIRMEFCAPITSHDLTGPVLRPKHSLWPSSSNLTQAHGCDVASDTANQNGKCWTYTGTATRTITSYTAGGISPGRRRWIYTGSAATWNQTTIDSIGTLPFNSRGWATIALPLLLVRDGSAQVVIRNNAAAAILTLDITGSQIKQGATVLAAWDHADRYALKIHLSSTGSIKGSLYNLTENNSAVNAWSFDLGTWTVGALGTATVSGTNVTLAHECDGLWVMRWSAIIGVDSLTQGDAAALSPAMAAVNGVAFALAPTSDIALVPDSAWTNRIHGMDFHPIVVVTGRAGATRGAMQANVLDQLTHARGIEVINVDGGSVNDIAGITSVGTQTSVLASLKTSIETMLDQGTAREWRIWVTTMIRRPLGGSRPWDALKNASIDLLNTQIRASASAKQSSWQHIKFSDVSTRIADHDALFNIPVDDIHPTVSGYGTIAMNMSLGYSTPGAGNGRRRKSIGLGLGLGRR